jgi:flagellar motor protein MotB
MRVEQIKTVMNYKRTAAAFMTACVMGFGTMPAMASGPEKEIKINEENFALLTEIEQQRVLEIKDRLEAIQNADRSSMTKEERKEMRSEFKELKKEVKQINEQRPVIYISATALLLIILLIILL